MVTPFVFQIVGYQNSGKTTFINSLIEKLATQNIKVGSIKHHGHGGKPDINENKDSATHIQSGANVSLVEGGGRLILQAEKTTWTLKEQIDILSTFPLDLLLIEGHKYEDYPKAVIIADEKDFYLLNKLSNIKVVLFREENLKELLDQSDLTPHFNLVNKEAEHWILNYIYSQLEI